MIASLPGLLVSTLVLSTAPEGESTAPEGEAKGSVSLDTSGAKAEGSTEGSNKPKKSKREDIPWIRRWAPERNMAEIGLFGGVIFPHPRVELFEAEFGLPQQGFRPLNGVAPEIGLRFGYLPLRILGLEVEGAVIPTSTADGQSATVYAARGHLLVQLPRWSVTPFVVAGPSGLGVVSDRNAVGNDIDLGFHFGGGVKIFMNRYTALRLDIRDTMTARRGVAESVVHTPEILLGLSVTLGRKDPEKPQGPKDTDGDGIYDPDDECVDVPGVAEYKGCPIPDTDGDGILDPDDECVEEPGVEEYKGCPIPDTDGDGILDPEDKCVKEPETKNGYEDEDGCPDKVPDEVKKYTGAIKGIFFATNKAVIRPKSLPVLKRALKVLQDFPHLRLEISGHTDDRGDDDHNMDLSRRRAEAVRDFFVAAGISENRFRTRGAGETEPIDTNKTKKGRAKNRRIEFKLLQD